MDRWERPGKEVRWGQDPCYLNRTNTRRGLELKTLQSNCLIDLLEACRITISGSTRRGA